MSTLAITGTTGFVGGHVIEQALDAGLRVQALVRRMTQGHFTTGSPQPLWIEGTLDSAQALGLLCEGADAVIHIAGAVNAPDRAAFAAANVAGTANILAAARAAGVRRFVHVSSLAAREPDLSDYGWSKAEAERLVMASPLDWVIVRPPGVYGPRDADMFELFRMARRGLVLLPPDGRGSWIYAADLARLLLALAADGPSSTILEPDDGEPLSHREMALRIGEAVGRPRPFALSAPRWLLHLAARGDRMVRGSGARLTPDRARYMAHPDWCVEPARRPDPALWRPALGSRAGFAETARWYAANGWLQT